MTVKVGINGFGRIGRLAFRRIKEVSDDIEVARTVKLPPLPTKTTAYANTFRVRYLDEVGESFRQRIPEKIGTKQLEKWTLVIPMLVIPPE